MKPKLELYEPEERLKVDELCRYCGVQRNFVEELVAEGVLQPEGSGRGDWRFAAISVTRVRRTLRLRQDLGVNLPGAALALDLLDEVESLRSQLRALGGLR